MNDLHDDNDLHWDGEQEMASTHTCRQQHHSMADLLPCQIVLLGGRGEGRQD